VIVADTLNKPHQSKNASKPLLVSYIVIASALLLAAFVYLVTGGDQVRQWWNLAIPVAVAVMALTLIPFMKSDVKSGYWTVAALVMRSIGSFTILVAMRDQNGLLPLSARQRMAWQF